MRENAQKAMAPLILGGTGKTGRRVAGRLGARDLPLRVGYARDAAATGIWDRQR